MAGVHRLTTVALKQWNPERGKESKLNDGGGLILVASRKGTKTWRFRYFATVEGVRKERNYTIGEFPAISLKEARESRSALQSDVEAGKDPWYLNKMGSNQSPAGEKSFRDIAQMWHDIHLATLTDGAQRRTWGEMAKHVLPVLGHYPIKQIRPKDITLVTDPIIQLGKTDTAKRVVGSMSNVFKYGIALEHCETNPADAAKILLPKHQKTHYKALLDWQDIRRFMQELDQLTGAPQTVLMAKLFPHVALRPRNIFGMRAEWVDFSSRSVEFPASAMKGDESKKTAAPHILPLSTQVRAILEEALDINAGSQWVFPTGSDHDDKPLSEATPKQAFTRMGFTARDLNPHGWRATFRTLTVESLGARPDLAEHCLAHTVQWPNGRAYDRTDFLPQRRVMMQDWSNFLFWLKNASDAELKQRKEQMAEPQESLI